jgi:competence protein ComEA
MNHRTLFRSVGALVLVSTLGLPMPVFSADKDLPEGAGKAELLRACTTCHEAERIYKTRYTRQQWTESVSRMARRGVQAGDDEVELILEYLVQNFAKSDKVNVNKADAGDLIQGLAFTAKDAQAVVDYRKQHGDYKTLQDLQKVEGLDLKRLEAVQEKVEF